MIDLDMSLETLITQNKQIINLRHVEDFFHPSKIKNHLKIAEKSSSKAGSQKADKDPLNLTRTYVKLEDGSEMHIIHYLLDKALEEDDSSYEDIVTNILKQYNHKMLSQKENHSIAWKITSQAISSENTNLLEIAEEKMPNFWRQFKYTFDEEGQKHNLISYMASNRLVDSLEWVLKKADEKSQYVPSNDEYYKKMGILSPLDQLYIALKDATKNQNIAQIKELTYCTDLLIQHGFIGANYTQKDIYKLFTTNEVLFGNLESNQPKNLFINWKKLIPSYNNLPDKSCAINNFLYITSNTDKFSEYDVKMAKYVVNTNEEIVSSAVNYDLQQFALDNTNSELIKEFVGDPKKFIQENNIDTDDYSSLYNIGCTIYQDLHLSITREEKANICKWLCDMAPNMELLGDDNSSDDSNTFSSSDSE